MKIFDLSHPLNNNSPVYPGKDHPVFESVATLERDGYRETHFIFDSHLGTHIDAPAHMLKDGKTLDVLPVEAYTGKALIIEIPDRMHFIETDFLYQYKNEIEVADFVLFKTGWSRFWGQSCYFTGFPTLTKESVKWLLDFNLKGIGFDAISADPVESSNWENHFAIFEEGLIIIENLIFPKELNKNSGDFCCLPLPYQNADGSPVRAILKI